MADAHQQRGKPEAADPGGQTQCLVPGSQGLSQGQPGKAGQEMIAGQFQAGPQESGQAWPGDEARERIRCIPMQNRPA
jgi:hypothetical protein